MWKSGKVGDGKAERKGQGSCKERQVEPREGTERSRAWRIEREQANWQRVAQRNTGLSGDRDAKTWNFQQAMSWETSMEADREQEIRDNGQEELVRKFHHREKAVYSI